MKMMSMPCFRLAVVVLVALAVSACAPTTVEELDDATALAVEHCSGSDCARVDEPMARLFTLCTDWIAVDAQSRVWARAGCAGEDAFHVEGSIDDATRIELEDAMAAARGAIASGPDRGPCFEARLTWRALEMYTDGGSDGFSSAYCEGDPAPGFRALEAAFDRVRMAP